MKLWFAVICLAVLCSTVSAELVAQYKPEDLPQHEVPQPPQPQEEKPHRKWFDFKRDGEEHPPQPQEEKPHRKWFDFKRDGEEHPPQPQEEKPHRKWFDFKRDGEEHPPHHHGKELHHKWLTIQRDGEEHPPHHHELKFHHERLCLLREGEEQEQQKGGPHCLPYHHYRRGAVTHCQSDFENLCGEEYENGQFKELWQCLIENVDKISNGMCKEWVKGMQACKNAATSLCGNQVHRRHEIRRCLRSLDSKTIPEDCRDSSFYNHTVRSHRKHVPRTMYIQRH